MKVLKVDEKGDPIIKSGKYVFAFDLEAVLVVCDQVMRTQLGEYRYSKSSGIEYFNNVFTGNPNFQQFRKQSIQKLQAVTGVVRVSRFEYNLENNILSYDAEIITEFGSGAINGSV